jgi:hypothetical protein
MGHYIGVRWKPGCKPHIEDYHGYKVSCAFMNDIECLVVKLQVNGRCIELHPEEFSVTIKFPGFNNKNVLKRYQIFQFLVNLALAITGHKLQGMTLDIIVLSEIIIKLAICNAIKSNYIEGFIPYDAIDKTNVQTSIT